MPGFHFKLSWSMLDKFTHTKYCKEVGFPKDLLLGIISGIRRHLCIAQEGISRESWCVFVMFMNAWLFLYDVKE